MSSDILTKVELTSIDHVIIVAYHLPLRVERDSNGYSIEWDDERGIDIAGLDLPTKITYVGCIELDVPSVEELMGSIAQTCDSLDRETHKCCHHLNTKLVQLGNTIHRMNDAVA